MKYAPTSKKAYHELMVEIYTLMNKGESNLKAAELRKLAQMSAAAEKYEDEVLGLNPIKEPKSIVELVELKMFEHKMTQVKLAEELGIATSKISEILSGKRKPDIPFLKAIYKSFKVDPGFLLEHA